MKKIGFFFCLLFLSVNVVNGQTITRNAEWDTTDSLTLVNTYTETLKVDALPAVVITPVCSTVGAFTHCKAPIILTPGTHTLVLTIINPGGLTSTASLNYNPGTIPSTPTSFTITIQIVIP